MLYILSLTIPFFAIILLGLLSRKFNLFNETDGRKIARFAFFIALPPFMFLNIISSPIKNIFDLEFILRYEICTILVFTFSCVIAKYLLKIPKEEIGIFGLNSSYPNYGYIGVPMALIAFGKDAAIPISLILVADSIVLLFLTAIFSYENKTNGILSSFSNLFISFVKNPILVAVISGFCFSIFEVQLPKIPNAIFIMLAGAAAPSALFALGITLLGQKVSTSLIELSFITFIKLILHPLLVSLLLIEWYLKNTTHNTVWIQTAILSACLPVAANVYSLSEYYKQYVGKTAAAITITTLFSSITVTLLLYFLYNIENYLLTIIKFFN